MTYSKSHVIQTHIFRKSPIIDRSLAYRNYWTLDARVGSWTPDACFWTLDSGR